MNSKQQERSSEKHGRRSWLRPPPGRTHNRRRSRLQAAPPHTSPSSWPPPGRAYVIRTLYRQHGRLQAARTRRRSRPGLRTSTRSAHILHVDGTFLIYTPPLSPYASVSAALQHSATHAVKGSPRTSQRDVVNCRGGAASRRQGYAKHHPPQGPHE